jgi:hypothetical protein
MRIAPLAVRDRIRKELDDPQFKERWLEEGKKHAAAYFVEPKHFDEPTPPSSSPPALVQARVEAQREEARALREHPEMRGVYADQKDPQLFKARLRLGIRVDRVATVAPGRAWVQLVGRNPDGSLYRFSELYVKIGDRWLQRQPPSLADHATLPKSFGPLLCSFAWYRAHRLEKLLIGPRNAPPPVDVASPRVSSEQRTCTACMGGVIGTI